MDANKLKILQAIGYSIPKVCGWCTHFTAQPMLAFGTCGAQTYQHLKHSDSQRSLSVYRYGSCSSFVPDQREVTKQGLFHQFAGDL